MRTRSPTRQLNEALHGFDAAATDEGDARIRRKSPPASTRVNAIRPPSDHPRPSENVAREIRVKLDMLSLGTPRLPTVYVKSPARADTAIVSTIARTKAGVLVARNAALTTSRGR